MGSTTVTSLLLPDFGKQSVVAEVLGAEATATTYLLNCPKDTDSTECGIYNNTITLGPWASKTVPSGADETGAFDFHISIDYDANDSWDFSIHCEMSKTVPKECTFINDGGNNAGTPTETLKDASSLSEKASFAYTAVEITSGAELLTATHSSSGKAEATGGEAQDGDDDDDAAAFHLPSVLTVGLITGLAAAWML